MVIVERLDAVGRLPTDVHTPRQQEGDLLGRLRPRAMGLQNELGHVLCPSCRRASVPRRYG